MMDQKAAKACLSEITEKQRRREPLQKENTPNAAEYKAGTNHRKHNYTATRPQK